MRRLRQAGRGGFRKGRRQHAGDERAFAGLFDEFGPRTPRYLTGLVGEEAEDVQPEELEGLLSGLPPPQQEVLLLRYRDDLSLGEIALIVGCPAGTVKMRIHEEILGARSEAS